MDIVTIAVFTVFLFGQPVTDAKVYGTPVASAETCDATAKAIIAQAYIANPQIEDIEYGCFAVQKTRKT